MPHLYDNMHTCPICGGDNNVDPKDFEGGQVSEAYTECTVCGFKDYWAFGYFESKES